MLYTVSMYTPKPYHEAWLPVIDGHAVYYAEYGNAQGPTIISVHGGPGSQSKSKHAALFDLNEYRVVLFDQRGCGQSTPAGEVMHNDIATTIADMERIRATLQVERWFVAGSSWGATVALQYAKQHSDTVLGLLLSAIFLANAETEHWVFLPDGGARAMFPDGVEEWQRHAQALGIDLSSPQGTAAHLYRLITHGSVAEQAGVAAMLHNWEANLLSRNIPVQFITAEDVSEQQIASATTFLHFWHHDYFLEDNEILRDSKLLRDIPTVIVHGRYDVLCPPQGAARLAQALPQAELVWLPESHHTFTGDGMVARAYIFRYFLKDVVTRR